MQHVAHRASDEIAMLRRENARLRRGLNIIAQCGTLCGGAWCVAQDAWTSVR